MKITKSVKTITFDVEGNFSELDKTRDEILGSIKCISLEIIEITFPKKNGTFSGTPLEYEAKMSVTCPEESFAEVSKLFLN